MKKILCSILGFLMLISLAAAQNNISITGKTILKKYRLELSAFNEQTMDYQPIASTITDKEGNFVLETAFTQPNMYKIDINKNAVVYLAIESAETIRIDYDGESKAKVKGSLATTKLREVQFELSGLQGKYFGELKAEMDAAMEANDKEKIAKLNEQVQVLLPKFVGEMRGLISQVDKSVALFHALNYSDFNKELAFIEEKVNVLKQVYPESPVTKALQTKIHQAKTTGVGKVPPAFSATTIKGQEVNLSDFKGKWVLVDFWASWCRACRIENPKFARLYEDYQAKGFEIISISKDESESKWKKAINKDGAAAWIHIWDENQSISKEYSISSLPQNVVISPDGKVAAKNVSAEMLHSFLKSNL